ncbi:MAG: polyphosphate kinase 2 [Asticcacaulis sp.]|nr:polyphosphate kinase 2 [Asticcacaulis sp.]
MSKTKDEEAEARLRELQIALVDTQIWAMKNGRKVCILFEGRDAAGKDGAIKRLTETLSVRNTRVIALPKPSDFDRGAWWFQRYVNHLPTAGEWVIYNRSWYNRAGVEKVMGFSTPEEQETFIRDVPDFEGMLVRSGITLIKLWLDISREEQKERLDDRRGDPAKRLKVSGLDAVAQERWSDYSKARDDMLRRSHHDDGHWICIATDSKKKAREHILRHVLTVLNCPDMAAVEPPDPDVVFSYSEVINGKRKLAK